MPAPRPHIAALALVLLMGGPVGPTAALAQEGAAGERLDQVEKSLEKSRREGQALTDISSRLARQISDLRKERVKAARTAHGIERRVAALTETIAELNAEHGTKTRALGARRARLADILGALQRMARQPPEALMALPGNPQDTLRSAILMRTVLPEIEAEARALKARLTSLATLKAQIRHKRRALANESKSLKRQRARLGKLLKRKTAFERTTRIERDRTTARARRLASEAKDLRGLLARIEAERKMRLAALRIAPPTLAPPTLTLPQAVHPTLAPPTLTPPGRKKRQKQSRKKSRKQSGKTPRKKAAAIRRARGTFIFPVQGRVVQRFGGKAAYGVKAKGISIQTLGGAQVVSPHDGVVVFSGKFRDYGQVLIIEHGGGYHSLLAGLKRIDSVVSQHLVAGEPVGVMAQPAKNKPRLYIELRRNGRPINPLPWLATPRDKVSG